MQIATKTVTQTQIAVIIAVIAAVGAYAMAFIPPLFNKQQTPPPARQKPYPIGVQQKKEARAIISIPSSFDTNTEINLFSDKESDVVSGGVPRPSSTTAPRSARSTDVLYSQPRAIIQNGPIAEKYNIVFLAPRNFSDEEIAQMARMVYSRGIQMYSPFREHWSVFNIFAATVNADDSSDHDYKEKLVSDFPHTSMQKVVFLSKMNFSNKKDNKILGYAHVDGDAFISLKNINTSDKKVYEKVDGFDLTTWSDSLDFRLWNHNQKSIFVEVVMHELGHAIGGLADEYVYSSILPSQPDKPNCKSIAPESWKQKIDTRDYASTQSAVISVAAGVFSGCAYSSDNKRSTNMSIMRPTLSYNKRINAISFYPFGYTSREALLQKITKAPYKEIFTFACGEEDTPACGVTSDKKTQGEECEPRTMVKKIPLPDGTTSNTCVKCPLGTEWNGNDGGCHICGKAEQPTCKEHQYDDGTPLYCFEGYMNLGGTCSCGAASRYDKQTDSCKILSEPDTNRKQRGQGWQGPRGRGEVPVGG